MLKNQKPLNSLFLFICAFLFATCSVIGQMQAEFAPASMSPIPNGPSSADRSARLLLNPSGTTFTQPNTTVLVTASLSNFQVPGVGTGSGNGPIVLGGTNNTGSGNVGSVPVFSLMNAVGSAGNTMYTNTTSGSGGIAVTANSAFDIYTSARQFNGTGASTTARHQIGDLTVTFSSPVTNPYLHFVGMGGTIGTLGLTTEVDLVSVGQTFTRLSGNTAFTVNSTQVNNGALTIGASCGANTGACGTVRVNGTNIQTIVLRVYLRGNGGALNWNTANHAGDRWMLGVSLPETISLSGNVFHDTTNDGTVNGPPINMPGGTQLFANLVDPVTGNIMGSAPVAPDGTFTFNGIPANTNIRVELSTIAGTALAQAPPRTLPFGWQNTGENHGTAPGTDGTPDGALSIAVGNTDVTNANFGIDVISPTSANVLINGRVATAEGRGLFRVYVTLLDPLSGEMRSTITNPFGYYTFNDVPIGTYVIAVSTKNYNFDPPSYTLDVMDNMTAINFTGFPVW